MLVGKPVAATQKIKPSIPTISIIEVNGVSEQIVALITHHFEALAQSTANIDQLQENLSKRLCAELMASVGVSVVEGDGKYESERVQAFLKPPSLKAIYGRYFARFWLHEDSVIFNKNPFNSAIAPNEEFKERLLQHCEQPPTHESISPSGWQNVKKLGKYQFSMDQLLGKGMSGEVYLGSDTDSGELVCVKVVDLMAFQSQKQKEMLKNQIQSQKMCQSDYILKILDVFDSNSFCFIITEYCPGGDAYKLLKSTPSGLPEPSVWKIAADLAKSLKVLKDARVIHRDIKSENILFGKHSLKLADFGFAISFKQQLSLAGKSAEGRATNVGSPLYMSPEALESSEYSYGSDVFSFGVVIYEMMHQRSPWECEDEQELKMKIRKEPVVFKPELSEKIKELLTKCLAARLQDRITIEEILTRVTPT